MTKQGNPESATSADESAEKANLLKATVLTSAVGPDHNAAEQSPGTAEHNFTSLLSMSSPEEAASLGLGMLQGQNSVPTGMRNEGSDLRQATSSEPSAKDLADLATNQEDINSNADTLTERGLQKKYFCKVCDQGFTRKHNMASHELIHSSSKPHVCRLCDSKFRRIHDLKRHEKLHTGEKPYHCSKCTRRFARPDALIRHQNSPNACSGNSQSSSRPNGIFLSHIVPATSNSPSGLSSPTTAPEVIGRESDLNRWKTYQQKLQHKSHYQPVYLQVLHLQHNNDTNPPKSSSSTIVSETEAQQGNDLLSGKENRDSYALLQRPYASKHNPRYFQLYPVGNNQPPHTANPLLPPGNQNSQQALQHSPDGYVTLEKYNDLIAYTRNLQEHVANLDARLKYLEKMFLRSSPTDDKQVGDQKGESSYIGLGQ